MFMSRPQSGSVPGSFAPPDGMANMPVQLGGGFFDQIINQIASAADELPQWSIWPNFRDAHLAQWWKTEPILAGALYSTEAKVATLGFQFKGKHKNTKAYYQNLAGTAHDGLGLSTIFQLTIHSLLTCDNGAFWYLHGAGRPDRPLRGRVVDIRFLDSAQCWRTYDPDYPVTYFNPFTGGFYRLHKSRVVMMSSMRQPNELGRGIGVCAVSRVLQAAQIIRDIRLYKREKIGGRPSKGMLLLQGVNRKQVEQAVQGTEEDADNTGFFRYKGVDVLASLNKELKGVLLDLASLPDGFNEKDDTQLYVNILALTVGTDPRDFWPAATAGATKGDAEVADKKARGKGIGDLLRTLRFAMNWRVLGKQSGVQFDFEYIDIDELVQTAQANNMKATTYKLAVDSGSIVPEEMRAMMINDGSLDASVLADLSASTNYDEASPVTDENEPEDGEQRSIFEVPESAVNEAANERQQQIMEQNNADNADENDPEDENSDKPKQRAKRRDFAASQPIDEPIGDEDIRWALQHLGNML